MTTPAIVAKDKNVPEIPRFTIMKATSIVFSKLPKLRRQLQRRQ